MPELPEVETMRRCIEPIVGRRIRRLDRPRSRVRPIALLPRLGDFRRRVADRRIDGASRLGKRVVVELDGGDRIVFEPRMSGLLLLSDPPDQEHLRLVFELSGRPRRRLLFWSMRGLGGVRLVPPRRFTMLYGPDRIGPDALEITAAELRRRLVAGRRAIKVALLDQRAVAGVGNLYASEILHRIGLHPETRCCDVRPRDWPRLHAAMREVLEDAIAHQGSTLRDGTYRIARDEPGNFQYRHRVYQRAGKLCVQCRQANVVRIVQTQRSTFLCPHCQNSK